MLLSPDRRTLPHTVRAGRTTWVVDVVELISCQSTGQKLKPFMASMRLLSTFWD